MSIIWKYLDKRSAAVDALKDYGSMKFIIGHTDEEVKSAYEKMGGVSSPQLDGMPRSHNPQASEDRIIKGIDCLLYTSPSLPMCMMRSSLRPTGGCPWRRCANRWAGRRPGQKG